VRHFLAIADLSKTEIENLLDLTLKLKKERAKGGNRAQRAVLAGKTLGMVFQKPSLRTRASFEMAMHHLGGQAMYLSPAEIGLGQRESVPDVARVLAGYVDAIMARVFDHQHVLTLAEYSKVPVINGLSDYNHPCQALADALTILERKKRLAGLTVSYVGDGNNVAASLAHICAKLGMNFRIGAPLDYELPTPVVIKAREFAAESGSQIFETVDPYEAVRDADVIYTDTWTSMGQEAEAEKRKAVFPPYQVNATLLSKAKPDAIVMHCLPAHRGHEITDEVADGPNSAIFPQAENRLHAQKAILVTLLAPANTRSQRSEIRGRKATAKPKTATKKR